MNSPSLIKPTVWDRECSLIPSIHTIPQAGIIFHSSLQFPICTLLDRKVTLKKTNTGTKVQSFVFSNDNDNRVVISGDVQ